MVFDIPSNINHPSRDSLSKQKQANLLVSNCCVPFFDKTTTPSSAIEKTTAGQTTTGIRSRSTTPTSSTSLSQIIMTTRSLGNSIARSTATAVVASCENPQPPQPFQQSHRMSPTCCVNRTPNSFLSSPLPSPVSSPLSQQSPLSSLHNMQNTSIMQTCDLEQSSFHTRRQLQPCMTSNNYTSSSSNNKCNSDNSTISNLVDSVRLFAVDTCPRVVKRRSSFNRSSSHSSLKSFKNSIHQNSMSSSPPHKVCYYYKSHVRFAPSSSDPSEEEDDNGSDSDSSSQYEYEGGLFQSDSDFDDDDETDSDDDEQGDGFGASSTSLSAAEAADNFCVSKSLTPPSLEQFYTIPRVPADCLPQVFYSKAELKKIHKSQKKLGIRQAMQHPELVDSIYKLHGYHDGDLTKYSYFPSSCEVEQLCKSKNDATTTENNNTKNDTVSTTGALSPNSILSESETRGLEPYMTPLIGMHRSWAVEQLLSTQDRCRFGGESPEDTAMLLRLWAMRVGSAPTLYAQQLAQGDEQEAQKEYERLCQHDANFARWFKSYHNSTSSLDATAAQNKNTNAGEGPSKDHHHHTSNNGGEENSCKVDHTEMARAA